MLHRGEREEGEQQQRHALLGGGGGLHTYNVQRIAVCYCNMKSTKVQTSPIYRNHAPKHNTCKHYTAYIIHNRLYVLFILMKCVLRVYTCTTSCVSPSRVSRMRAVRSSAAKHLRTASLWQHICNKKQQQDKLTCVARPYLCVQCTCSQTLPMCTMYM